MEHNAFMRELVLLGLVRDCPVYKSFERQKSETLFPPALLNKIERKKKIQGKFGRESLFAQVNPPFLFLTIYPTHSMLPYPFYVSLRRFFSHLRAMARSSNAYTARILFQRRTRSYRLVFAASRCHETRQMLSIKCACKTLDGHCVDGFVDVQQAAIG